MKKILLFGNGQVAASAYAALTHDSPHDVAAFTVDGRYLNGDGFLGLPVIPFEELEAKYPPEDYAMLISISYQQVNKLRAEKYYQAKNKGYSLISYISSKANTWPDLKLGDNCFIGANCDIGPFVEIGNNVTLGSGTIVGHHSIIKDHASMAARVVVSGSVTIEPYCFLGANSTIRDRVHIASACVIGAGALILQDTRPKEVYLGRAAELLPLSSDELPLG